ncbi:MAG: hypothetical protein ABIF71_11565 [Planctomycetota bacterium]
MEGRHTTRCEYIVGLDIGTASAKCMIGEVSDGCNLKVVGADEIDMAGNAGDEALLGENARQITTLVKRLEAQTRLTIYTVYATVGRGDIKGLNMTGAINLSGNRVQAKHCERVRRSAERLSIPHGLEILHVLPQQYYLDESRKVVDPIGFSAHKLEMALHLITCDSKSLNQKRRLIKTAGYGVEGLVVNGLASFYGGRGLYSREKDVLVVNIGAANTDLLFFVDGQIVTTSQLMFGLNDIVSEFEYRFGITGPDARKLLRAYMQCCAGPGARARKGAASSFTIIQKKISGGEGRFFSDYKKISGETISLVVAYMVSQVIEKIKSNVIAYLAGEISGIQVVLMGGGAYLPETEREFRDKFGCEIIIGENKFKSGGDLYGTAYGLLRYGLDDRRGGRVEQPAGLARRLGSVVQNLSTWASVKMT